MENFNFELERAVIGEILTFDSLREKTMLIEETDFQVIIRDLSKELNNNWKSLYEKVYKFLKLSSQKQ